MARSRPSIVVVGRAGALCRALQAAGYACLPFEDPLRALAYLSEAPADLLLVHEELPVLGGRQVVAAARSRGRPLPAILLGADALAPGDPLVDRLPAEATPAEVVALVERRLAPDAGALRR